MKLSKEVVDLECSDNLNFNKEFDRITNLDPEFAKIIEYYEDRIIDLSNKFDNQISITNKKGEQFLLLRSDVVTNLFHRFALNIHRIMSAQAEIDEVEKECGTKETD